MRTPYGVPALLDEVLRLVEERFGWQPDPDETKEVLVYLALGFFTQPSVTPFGLAGLLAMAEDEWSACRSTEEDCDLGEECERPECGCVCHHKFSVDLRGVDAPTGRPVG